MKKTIYILNLIFSTLIFAQNPESSTLYEKEYYNLLNYIPKNLKTDSIHKLESPILKGSLNTIASLKLYNGFREEFKLPENDIKWLEKRIDQIASELFIDGKRILISADGGYGGCPKFMLDNIKLNNIEISNLHFCYTCTEPRDYKFINIFNNRMYSLMNIEPPNARTRLFIGEYKGRNKDRFKIKLILKKDRPFKFWVNKGHGSDFTEGLWKNIDDKLILKSRNLNKDDDISFALSSAKWIEFNDLKFRLKKGKLTELNGKNRKLKQIVE